MYKSLKIKSISDDYYGKNGTQASFRIEAEGNGTVTYQWQYRTSGTTSWRTPALASAKTADYVFKLRPSYDKIVVRCIVSDDSGSSLTSDVRKAIVFAITSPPQDAELELGKKRTFTVEAVGKDLAYQWYCMRPEASWKKVAMTGYNTAAPVITENKKNDGTKYRCRVTDGLGNVLVSSAAMLTQKYRFRNQTADRIYYNRDFDYIIILVDRIQEVAFRVTEYLQKYGRMQKTIVFCATEDVVERMRIAVVNMNKRMVQKNSDYVGRITGSDDYGKRILDYFISVSSKYPVIATMSELLSTGSDCKMTKLIVLDKNINSMMQFKQVIGRGIRVQEDQGKFSFTIMDFRGVTRLFAIPTGKSCG